MFPEECVNGIWTCQTKQSKIYKHKKYEGQDTGNHKECNRNPFCENFRVSNVECIRRPEGLKRHSNSA